MADENPATEDLSTLSFAECISQYNEYCDAIEQTKTDDSLRDLYQAVYDGAAHLAAHINSLVDLTPDVALLLPEETSTTEPLELTPSIDFPATPGEVTSCPFEIFYDKREWLPCVILEVLPPASGNPVEDAIRLSKLTVGVLGYNAIVEDVESTQLRVLDASSLMSSLQNGVQCHGVHPTSHRFEPCVVQRLTLGGGVMVTFEGSAEGATEVELPLSHIHLGKVYKELRRTLTLTDAEKAERRQEMLKRKRERQAVVKEVEATRVTQSAATWQSDINDMMVDSSAAPKKRRR